MAGYFETMEKTSDKDLTTIALMYPMELRKFCILVALEYQLFLQNIDDNKRTA